MYPLPEPNSGVSDPTSDSVVERPEKDGRGAVASHPLQIPLAGWRDILLRVKAQLVADNIGIVSAGVAFYALLAVFPALSAIVAAYGFLFDPADVQRHMTLMIGLLPVDARQLLLDQLGNLAKGSTAGLGIGVFVGFGVALWSATKGAKAIIAALNIVYKERESRGLIRVNLLALTLTFCAIAFVLLAMISVIVIPTIMNLWSGLDIAVRFLAWMRWPVIALIMMTCLSAVYRFGPSRSHAKWRWLSAGSVVATLLWIAGSWLFSQYVALFGNYNETYGSIGAVVILLMWFFVSTWIVLLGAEINAEIEHQTKIDTTTGAAQPIGERDAYMADTVGKRFDLEDETK